MLGILPRGGWGRIKPPAGTPIDRGARHGATLVGSWDMREGGGLLLADAASGYHARVESGITWGAGSTGPALKFDLSHKAVVPATPKLYQLKRFTVEALFYYDSATANQAIVEQTGASNGLNLNWLLFIEGSALKWRTCFNDISTFAEATFSLTGGRWYHAVGTYDGVSTRLWVDGVLRSTSTAGSGTPNPAGAGELRIGILGSDFYPFRDRIEFVRVYEGAIPAASVPNLRTGLYDQFAPPVWRRYFVPAGVAAEAVAGLVGGVSAVSGTLSSAVPVAAAATGVSAVSGTLSSTVPVSASSAGVSTAAATARATATISATSAGASTAAGTVTVAAGVVGSVAGAASVSGTLRSTIPVAAASAGASAVAGTLSATIVAIGAIVGAATTAGALRATAPLNGSSAGVSTVSGALASQGQELAVGSAAGVSSISGSMASTVPISADAAGTTNVSGALSVAAGVAGSAAGTTAVAGVLRATVVVSGTVAGVSTVSADLTVTPQAGQTENAIGTSAGVSTIAGSLSAQVPVAAASVSSSTLVAMLRAAVVIAGTATGASAVSGSVVVSGGYLGSDAELTMTHRDRAVLLLTRRARAILTMMGR